VTPRAGIALMIAATFVFALQDGLSRYLAAQYNVVTVVMIRYWFFALFVLGLSAARKGGIRRVARTGQPILQISRGVLLVLEIFVTVAAFTKMGLIGTHAIFAAYPLIIAALSGPFLGEHVGWRRWLAVLAGFGGILIILRPGFAVFTPVALIPLFAAFLFALYGLLTRYAARRDSPETSFFWTGLAGAVAITLIGPFYWQPMQGNDWWIMGALAVSGVLGHFLLIKAYALAEAASLQPFAYFQLVFVSVIGLTVFHETLDAPTITGAAVITASGLFTLRRSR